MDRMIQPPLVNCLSTSLLTFTALFCIEFQILLLLFWFCFVMESNAKLDYPLYCFYSLKQSCYHVCV